jgi:hypothetical protein
MTPLGTEPSFMRDGAITGLARPTQLLSAYDAVSKACHMDA